MAKDQILTPAAVVALRTWVGQMQQLCELAGEPMRAAELVTSGVDLVQARQLLLEARAVGLRSHESIMILTGRTDPDDEDGLLPAVPAATATPELIEAQQYARMCGELAKLAGYEEMATDFIQRQTPLRLVRQELQEAQRAANAANPISNIHMPGQPTPAMLPDAHRIYRARAIAMGQKEPRP